MITISLSPLFINDGLAIHPSHNNEAFWNIEASHIISLFERHGVLLFRGFSILPEDISNITDMFSEAYTPDALRRMTRFGQQMIHNVDAGNSAIALHSEASFGAAWPEIIWFYCNIPPDQQGATTLCDGIRLWQDLSKRTQQAFLAQPLRYETGIDLGSRDPTRAPEPWPFAMPGISGVINWEQGQLNLSILRYAVQQTRLPRPNDLCFTNHLLIGCDEPQIKTLTMADASPLAAEIIEEIKHTAEKLTFELEWQSRDLLMLDNRRFMHGRRFFAANTIRDIVQIQTDRASFAYGASTRRGLNKKTHLTSEAL